MDNPAAILVSSVLAASLAGVVVWSFARGEGTPAPAAPVTDAALAARLDALDARLAELDARLANRSGSAPVRTAADVPTRADVERWIADALAARVVPVAAGDAEFGVDAAVAQLVDVGVNGGEASQSIWAAARAAGRVKDLIAAFERRAQEAPNSADAQADLGDAYVQGIVSAGDMMEQSLLGQKADRAYDAALDVDDTHWRARFSKAVGLTFWPDFLGKKKEAIRHLEVLATQQEALPVRPEFKDAWVTLGNLYAQQGKDDDARRAWERGLAQFPDDPTLRQKLGR